MNDNLEKAREIVAKEAGCDRDVVCEIDIKRCCCRDAAAAILALAEPKWRPIESAPKDGTTILVFGLPKSIEEVEYKKSAVYTAAWDDIDRMFCLSGGTWKGPFVEPTHWLPRPLPPKKEQ